MTLWLTRQRDGNYMLTRLRPLVTAVRGTRERDAYMLPGEPIGIRHLCAAGVAALIGVTLEPLQSIQVEVSARALP